MLWLLVFLFSGVIWVPIAIIGTRAWNRFAAVCGGCGHRLIEKCVNCLPPYVNFAGATAASQIAEQMATDGRDRGTR